MKSHESQDEVTDERRLSVALSSLREAYSRQQARPSTEEQLLAQFRLASTPTRREPGTVWGYWALAAAALLLACGLALWIGSAGGVKPQPIAHAPTNQIRAGSVTAEGRSDRIVSPPPQISAVAKPSEPKKTRHPVAGRSARLARNSQKPKPGTFIATMIPAPTDSDYGLQLIRVELPRRTMMSFGLPVDPRQLDRPVKADLIIGPDGLTRAIRFVQ